jgi:hypothetical protein
MRAAHFAATRADTRVSHQAGDVRPNRRDVLDELFATTEVENRFAAVRTAVKFDLNVIVYFGRLLAMGRRMALGSPRRTMLIGRLTIFVLATKRGCGAMNRTLKFFDAFLKLFDQLAKLLVLRLQLLNELVARIGVHAILLASRTPNVTLQVCAVDNHRASKNSLYFDEGIAR